MSLTLPSEVAWVLDLLGFSWPEADEDEIHKAAEAWRTFAATVAELETRGAMSAGQVRSSSSGDAIEGFEDAWRKFSDGGSGYMSDARMAAEIIAFALDAIAIAVVASKIAVIAQLIALAIEIIAAQAAAPLTFGISEAGAVGATQITRVIVRRLLDEMKRVIVQTITDAIQQASVKAIKEMVIEVVKTAAADALKAAGQDLVKQSVGVHFGAQDGYDLKGTATRAAGDFTTGVKDGLTEGFTGIKDGIVGLADPNTYVDAATGRATEVAGHHAQQGLNHAAGRPNTTAADPPAPAPSPVPDPETSTADTPAPVPAPSPVPAPETENQVRSVFG